MSNTITPPQYTYSKGELDSMLRQSQLGYEIQNEKEIDEYKKFYRTHLLHLDKHKREATLKQFSTIKKISNSELTSDKSKLVFEVNWLFNEHLKPPLKSIYDKEVEVDFRPEMSSSDKFWERALVNMVAINKFSGKKRKLRLEKQNKLLNLAEDCLRNYGLSQKIQNRCIDKKRYNLSIITKSGNPVKPRLLLSRKELNKDFLDKYSQKRPIIIEGIEIHPSDIYQVKITSTLLKDDEIELFALKNDFEWDDNFRDELAFIQCCKDETDNLLNNLKRAIKGFYAEVEQLLQPYSEAHKAYCKALSKLEIESNAYDRNIVDDLRLSFEELCRELIGNNKPIEKQIKEDLGRYLNEKNISNYINKIAIHLLVNYKDYMNGCVKHSDKVNKNEVEFMFDMTSSAIKLLISA